MLLVPESITPEIAAFASTLSAGSIPMVVRIVPAHDAAYLSCWQNVQDVCKRCGGQPINGWRVWWIPQILIEAQAHVVWQAAEDQLFDVTPNEDGEQNCVFVCDPDMTARPGIDFVPSRHENLTGEAFIDEYIRCATVLARHQDDVETTPLWLPDPPERAIMSRLLNQISERQKRLADSVDSAQPNALPKNCRPMVGR